LWSLGWLKAQFTHDTVFAMQDPLPRLAVLARRLLSALKGFEKAIQGQVEAVTEATEAARTKQSIPPEVRAEVSLPHGIETRKSATDARGDRIYQRVALLVSVLTLLAVSVYAGLVYLQLREMIGATGASQDAVHEARLNRQQSQKSLDASIENFHTDQRAWVGPIDIVLHEMHAPDPISAAITITNTGKTPAFKMKLNYLLHASDTPINVREYLKNPDEKQIGKASINTLFPNSRMGLLPATGATDALGIQSIGNGRKLLYLVVQIWYSDAFDVSHETRFCALWHPEWKTFAPCTDGFDYAN
jgi:hypothetical protein